MGSLVTYTYNPSFKPSPRARFHNVNHVVLRSHTIPELPFEQEKITSFTTRPGPIDCFLGNSTPSIKGLKFTLFVTRVFDLAPYVSVTKLSISNTTK